MWTLTPNDEILNSRVQQYVVRQQNDAVSYRQVVELWQHDVKFCEWFVDKLLENTNAAIRWETPGVTTETVDRPFEFVIVDSPDLNRPASPSAFQRQFQSASPGEILAFENLGRNAMMVVPTPIDTDSSYCHLLSFLRTAKRTQTTELWRVVGQEMNTRIGSRPVWLSTAGGGVAWLHVRLDNRPKYYSFQPYREEEF